MPVTTNEWVAVFVGIVTAITTVVGGTISSSRVSRLRKAIAEDLAIVNALPLGQAARTSLKEGVARQSAELAALVLHPMRASTFIFAFVAFVMWGVVLIVYITEGSGPLMFAEGVGRGLVNWVYLIVGLTAFVLFLRGVRRTAGERARERASMLGRTGAERSRRSPSEADTTKLRPQNGGR
jgi:hypothetical protein